MTIQILGIQFFKGKTEEVFTFLKNKGGLLFVTVNFEYNKPYISLFAILINYFDSYIYDYKDHMFFITFNIQMNIIMHQ